MKIVILSLERAAAGPTDRHTGVERYCRSLIDGLHEIGHDARLVGAEDARGFRGWLATLREATALRPQLIAIGDPGLHAAAMWWPPRLPYVPIFYGTDAAVLRQRLAPGRIGVTSALRRSRARAYVRNARGRVVISRYTQSLLEDAVGPLETTLVHPPVGRRHLAITPAPEPPPRPFRVVTIGRISERKNQLGTLRALAALAERHGVSFHYDIVGNVDSSWHAGYAAELERFVSARGLDGSVTIHSRATDEETIAILDRSHLCVALSRPSGPSVEGFGMTVVEAGARARAVLVSDHGGLLEAVEHGVTGLASSLEESAVVEALSHLAGDPARRRRMGEAGRRRALERFTPRHMAESFLRGVTVSSASEVGGLSSAGRS